MCYSVCPEANPIAPKALWLLRGRKYTNKDLIYKYQAGFIIDIPVRKASSFIGIRL